MTGGDAGTTVWSVPVSFGECLECLDGASPVCVVPRLFEQARWCTRTSPCSSSPRRRGSIWGAKCRMAMDSRLRGNDEWICGNDEWICGNDEWICGNDWWICGNDKWIRGNDGWICGNGRCDIRERQGVYG